MPTCALCGRSGEGRYFERHHLRPGSGRKESPVIIVDWQCGDMVHRLFSNLELRQRYDTLEALRAAPQVQRWVKWVARRPLERRIPMRRPKRS